MSSIGRRVGKKGTTWRARVILKGAKPQVKTFLRKVDAQEWAAKTEARIRDGQSLPDRQERSRTVHDLTGYYRTTTLTAYSAVERRKRLSHLGWWDRQLGDRKVIDLTPPDFSEALRKLAAGAGPVGKPVGPSTQVRYLATIRHVFSVACKDWGWLAHNPAARPNAQGSPRPGAVPFARGTRAPSIGLPEEL
jgi:hypothetical protein